MNNENHTTAAPVHQLVGRALDDLVAEKVMGWKVHPRNTAHWMRAQDDMVEYRPVASTCGSDRFAPSRNITDAWRVVEHMAAIEQRNAIWWNCTAGAFVCIDIGDELPKSLARIMFDCPDKMPLAICLAALEAFGVSPNARAQPAGEDRP